MFKTSLAVAMFLGAANAHRHHHTPVSVNYFADGMEGHEDLNTTFQVGKGEDKVVIKDQHVAQSAVEIKNGCEKGETLVDGNCAFEFTNVQLDNTKDHNKKDIGNGEVRPDVWVEVHKMVNPTSQFRTKDAPKTDYEPYAPAGTGKKEKEWGNPSAKEVADKIKKDKTPKEETEEEKESKTKAKPVKKANPESEEGDLEPKEETAPEGDLVQTVAYDSKNHLWRY